MIEVPQGSHLGPIVFILFINDITQWFSFVKFLICAGDITLFATVSCISNTYNIQKDLDALFLWSHTNNMFLQT